MGYKHCRSTILDRGTELIRQKGYHNVGINEILKVCGIPKGSFYNFFKSKEDFIEQSMRNYGAQGASMIEQYLTDASQTPINRLKRFYQAMIENFDSEGCTSGCLLANLSMEIGGTNDHLAAVADETFQQRQFDHGIFCALSSGILTSWYGWCSLSNESAARSTVFGSMVYHDVCIFNPLTPSTDFKSTLQLSFSDAEK